MSVVAPSRALSSILLCLTLMLPAASLSASQLRIETVANAEMVFPGDVEFYGFRWPVVNDAGDVAFESTGVSEGYGVWRIPDGGAPELFLQTYIEPPGVAPGARLDLVDGILLPETGDTIVVTSDLSDGNLGVFSVNLDSGLSTLAVEQGSAPGTDGVFDWIHPSLRISDAGEVAFHADLDPFSGSTTVSNSRGVWFGGAGSLELVARRDIDTGLGVDSYWKTVGEYPRVTPGGTLVFHTNLIDFSGTRASVWTGTDSGVSPALSNGDGAFSHSVIAENGILAAIAQVGDASSDYSLRVGTPGSMRTVIESSDVAPGVGTGRSITLGDGFAINFQLRVNRPGKVAFAAQLSCDPQTEMEECRQGIWSEGTEGLELVALEGDPAPGTLGDYDEFLGLEFNDLGQVAFIADTTDGNTALYFAEPGEAPHLVVRDGVGATFEYRPGDQRLVLYFSATLEWADFLHNANHGGLSDTGELVFSVETDGWGSGLYKATLPEPTGDLLGFVALATLVQIRARRK